MFQDVATTLPYSGSSVPARVDPGSSIQRRLSTQFVNFKKKTDLDEALYAACKVEFCMYPVELAQNHTPYTII